MILLYIFVFAIVSGCILIFSDRRQKGESIVRYGLKSIVFFFALYYFLLSAVKLCLGSIQNTLMESFWDAEIDFDYSRLAPVTFIRLCHKFDKVKGE